MFNTLGIKKVDDALLNVRREFLKEDGIYFLQSCLNDDFNAPTTTISKDEWIHFQLTYYKDFFKYLTIPEFKAVMSLTYADLIVWNTMCESLKTIPFKYSYNE